MAHDLASLPNCGIDAQICGDAHVLNLGCFGGPDGSLVFSVNDFDETIQGPWEWDVKRLATSLVLAAREAGDSDDHAQRAVHEFVSAYRMLASRLSDFTFLDLMRYQVRHVAQSATVRDALHRAERSTPEHTLSTLTVPTRNGTPRFRKHPPLMTAVAPRTAKFIQTAIRDYRETLSPDRQFWFDQYVPVDTCFKVVGTGSIGLRDFVVLLLGNGPHDSLFLQIKQEIPSAYAEFVPRKHAFVQQGRRVVEGERRMQEVTDPLLGWTSIEGRDYLVRQLNDHKASIDAADLKGDALLQFAKVCGSVLAKGHSRSSDPAVIAGYCGDNDKLDKAITRFALEYADQTTADHESFVKAVRRGKIRAARSTYA